MSTDDFLGATACFGYVRGYADAQNMTVTIIRRKQREQESARDSKPAYKAEKLKAKPKPAAKSPSGPEVITDPAILAELEALEANKILGNYGVACVPQDTQIKALVRAVTRFVEDSPQNSAVLEMPPDFLVSFAFLRAFPCR